MPNALDTKRSSPMRRTGFVLAAGLPLLGMLIPMATGLFVPGYSSVGQQMSEMEALGGAARWATQFGALASGIGIALFAVLAWRGTPRRMPFTALAALVFGASIASNGIFLYGSPWHGLYGVGFIAVLVPAFFAAESPRLPGQRADAVSLAVALLVMTYMWMMLARLDPMAWRGLTQRVASFPAFGWYAYAALRLLRSQESVARRVAGDGAEIPDAVPSA